MHLLALANYNALLEANHF